jgi:hypothetical protein
MFPVIEAKRTQNTTIIVSATNRTHIDLYFFFKHLTNATKSAIGKKMAHSIKISPRGATRFIVSDVAIPKAIYPELAPIV